MKKEIKQILEQTFAYNVENDKVAQELLDLFSVMHRCSACKFWKQTTNYEHSTNDGICNKLNSTDKVTINLHLGWEGGYVNTVETEEDFYCHLFECNGAQRLII
jgi:hypothetical protein